MVVGAIHEGLFELSSTQSRPGAAYVFLRTNGVWAEAPRLAASPADGPDMYGLSIALEGDLLAIGAPYESTAGSRSGAVYIYERAGGMFVERQKIKSAAPRAGAFFGSRFALKGDQLVVGASNDSTVATNNGSAEVFLRKAGTWTSVQRLSTPMPIADANFGYALGIQGSRIAVGAPRTASLISTVMTPPGEVYVFDRDAGTDHWTQSAVLHAIAPDESDFFGLTLAFTETSLVIGAPGDASGARGVGGDPKRTDAQYGGALYVFGLGPDGWTPSVFFKGHNTDASDGFGWPFAIDGDTLVVSAGLECSSDRGVGTTAMGNDNASQLSGAIYVFR